MKRKVQCYLAFTPRLYRILIFVVVPALLFALQAAFFKEDSFYGMFVAAILIAPAEVFVDALAFGGIASREAGGMEYLKSSVRGEEFLCTAISVNLVRQLLEETLILLVCQEIASGYRRSRLFEKGELSIFLAILMLGYFMTVIGVTAARFFTSMMFITFVPCFVIVPTFGILWVMMRSYALALALLVILTAAAGVGGIWFVRKRGRESYYDKADENRI